MDKSLIILGALFLLIHTVKVGIYAIDTFYSISCDMIDREKIAQEEAKEEEEKNKMEESVKHLYS